MKFETTEIQNHFLDTIDKFMDRVLPPAEVRRRDQVHQPPYDLLPVMGKIGIFGITIPEQYGGSGLDWTTLALVQERLGQRGYMAASILNRVVGFGIMSFMTYGNAAQKEEFLPKLADGSMLIALALSESEAGTDAAAIRTRAVPADGGWLINGRKTWISDAGGANYLLTAVRTDQESSGKEGISLLLVPPDAPGVSMTELPKIGNNCMPSWDIGLDEVFVPATAMVGDQGRGFSHLMSTLHFSRASMAASVTGCALAAVDCAISHACERRQFGRPIGSFQAIRHRIADMQMRVDATRLVVRHLAWLIATGRPCRREAAQAKVQATECLQFVTDHGMQIMASAGYSSESDMQRYWRDGRLYSFGEGTNEIQRNIIARELGL
jgi:alkylation response protein AidB-like acyl-CoA dehydrogenase